MQPKQKGATTTFSLSSESINYFGGNRTYLLPSIINKPWKKIRNIQKEVDLLEILMDRIFLTEELFIKGIQLQGFPASSEKEVCLCSLKSVSK